MWVDKYGHVLLIWDEVSENFSASEVMQTGKQLLVKAAQAAIADRQ